MSVQLADLPQRLAGAIADARAKLGDVEPVPFVAPPIDPEVREWIREAIRSGDLAAAIAEVAATDPDLAS